MFCIKKLLAFGADKVAVDRNGCTAFILAAGNG